MPEAGRIERLAVRSRKHAEAIDVTQQVKAVVDKSGVRTGLCHVYVEHTTAGVFINENADPEVMEDFLSTLDRLVPWNGRYQHAEGNAAAHIKSSLLGTAQSIPIYEGRLQLGRWQGIYLAEFDGPRDRQLRVTVLG